MKWGGRRARALVVDDLVVVDVVVLADPRLEEQLLSQESLDFVAVFEEESGVDSWYSHAVLFSNHWVRANDTAVQDDEVGLTDSPRRYRIACGISSGSYTIAATYALAMGYLGMSSMGRG